VTPATHDVARAMMLRESRKHPLTRTVFALGAIVFASCLAAASGSPSSTHACADLESATNFDYLVLASIADSPRLPAMAGYRSAAMQRAELIPGTGPTAVTAWRIAAHCVDHGATAYGPGPPVLAADPNLNVHGSPIQ